MCWNITVSFFNKAEFKFNTQSSSFKNSNYPLRIVIPQVNIVEEEFDVRLYKSLYQAPRNKYSKSKKMQGFLIFLW